MQENQQHLKVLHKRTNNPLYDIQYTYIHLHICKVIRGETNKDADGPTVGFNVECIKYGAHRLAIYDIGGQDMTRNLWQHYYNDTRAIIFMIDSADQYRLLPDNGHCNSNEDIKEDTYDDNNDDKTKLKSSASVKEELTNLLNEPALAHCKNYLIFANKQDLDNALSPFDLEAKLGLRGCEDKNLHFQASSAIKGEGIKEGLDWLINAVYKNK